MKSKAKNSQSGIALLTALFGLMLLSAIAMGLVYVARTETQVNYNYRNEQVAYFAAKAGIEEARDRMMPSNANYFGAALPNSVPAQSGGVLYMLNEGNAAGTVQPWNANNAYFDDELCHDGYGLNGLTTVQPDLRCTTAPNGAAWYNTVASAVPWSGTSAALPYKWVRIAVKLNYSEQDYPVNSPGGQGTPVCWDGANERLLTAASCQQMADATAVSMTPVYILTSLAVAPNGARKMVQAEVALNPSQGFIYGMFATGTGCGVLTLTGGSTTDSFTSANGGTYGSTHTNTGGDIGTNGNVTLSGSPTQVGGAIGVLAVPPQPAALQGPCPAENYTTSGGAGMVNNPANIPCGLPTSPADCLNTLQQPVVMATPPAPNPPPPNATYNPPTCGSGKGSGLCIVPGTYGNITLSGNTTLTMSPGVYNINSITVTGNSTIDVTSNPPGQVILNVAGNGVNTPVDLTGSSVTNQTGIANNFQINYGGTGGVKITGGSQAYMVVYAPNAAVQVTGGSDLFGAIAGKSIADTGGTAFHYDRNTHLTTVPSSGYLQMISYRDVAY